MYLYLIQHGEAKSEAEDPARPLSEKGIRDARKVASFISSNTRIDVEYINHSGKVRAAQTAEIFSEYIRMSKGAYEAEGLAPMDDPAEWAWKDIGVRSCNATHSILLTLTPPGPSLLLPHPDPLPEGARGCWD